MAQAWLKNQKIWEFTWRLMSLAACSRVCDKLDLRRFVFCIRNGYYTIKMNIIDKRYLIPNSTAMKYMKPSLKKFKQLFNFIIIFWYSKKYQIVLPRMPHKLDHPSHHTYIHLSYPVSWQKKKIMTMLFDQFEQYMTSNTW